MHLKSLLFVLVILSGSGAALPDLGTCSFMEYFCDARKCQTHFFKGLQKDPNGDCSAKFSELTRCVIKTVDICAGDVLPQSQIESIVHKKFQETTFCLKGGSNPVTSVGSRCRSSYSTDANNCLRTFHQTFAADKSDPELCSEYAKAKKCMKNLVASACSFSSSQQELLNLGFSDYNPFCENNRDPGATGNDQCFGVKELNNPFHSSSPTKTDNLQAVLVLVLVLLFII
ncbi:unnamed protein product [Porites lobata]|uniref:Uncharacterized protein n=1 Tax=Porites lobata TaxID=104759 RepID=A0ABN8RJ75_9CNID|nr:unnamed protein product [Porites lobata]